MAFDAGVDPVRRKFYLASVTVRSFSTGLETGMATGLASVVLFTSLYERTKRGKLLVLLTNLAEIIGNLVYSLGSCSRYYILVGRLICGFGDGFAPVVYEEIGASLPPSVQMGTLSLMEGARALGSVIGPLLNLALIRVDVHFGNWHIVYGSAVGLVLCVLFLMVQCLAFIFVYDMAKESKRQETHDCRFLLGGEGSDREFLLVAQQPVAGVASLSKEVATWEITIVLAADSLYWLTMGTGTALLPLALTKDLDWPATDLVIVYAGIFTLISISVVAVQLFPPKFDSRLLLACTGAQALVEASRLAYHYQRPNQRRMGIAMVTGSCLFAVFSAANVIVGRRLLTKLLRTEFQPTAQYLYNIWVGLLLSISPLIGSCVLYNLNVWASLAIVGYVFIGIGLVVFNDRIDRRMQLIADCEQGNDGE